MRRTENRVSKITKPQSRERERQRDRHRMRKRIEKDVLKWERLSGRTKLTAKDLKRNK